MPVTEKQNYRAAADAAARRAATCRRRFEALRRADAIEASDAAEAARALVEAVRRAQRARASLQAARARRDVLTDVPRVRGRQSTERDTSGPNVEVQHWLQARGVGLDELFTTYLTVGGTCSKLEVDAFAHGALSIPEFEQTALRHAMWEMDAF